MPTEREAGEQTDATGQPTDSLGDVAVDDDGIEEFDLDDIEVIESKVFG